MIGGFQVGPFQTAYQQVEGDAPVVVVEEQRGGGDRKRRKRRKGPYGGLTPIRPEVMSMGRPQALASIETMTVTDIDQEIAVLLRKKMRTLDEEMALALLLALMA
jgi:hypothetical protein